jgi:uncharacterized lipoprotein
MEADAREVRASKCEARRARANGLERTARRLRQSGEATARAARPNALKSRPEIKKTYRQSSKTLIAFSKYNYFFQPRAAFLANLRFSVVDCFISLGGICAATQPKSYKNMIIS